MNADTKTEPPHVAVSDGGGRRGRRRGRAALVVIVVVAIGAVAVAMAGVLKRTAAPEAGGGGAFRTSTALVTRRTLVSQTQVSATLAGRRGLHDRQPGDRHDHHIAGGGQDGAPGRGAVSGVRGAGGVAAWECSRLPGHVRGPDRRRCARVQQGDDRARLHHPGRCAGRGPRHGVFQRRDRHGVGGLPDGAGDHRAVREGDAGAGGVPADGGEDQCVGERYLSGGHRRRRARL